MLRKAFVARAKRGDSIGTDLGGRGGGWAAFIDEGIEGVFAAVKSVSVVAGGIDDVIETTAIAKDGTKIVFEPFGLGH